MNETTEILDALRAPVLVGLARRLGLPKSLTRKDEVVAALAGYLHSNLPALLAHLNATEKLVVAEAAHNGPVDPRRFAARHGVRCPVPLPYESTPSSASPLLLLFGNKYHGRTSLPETMAAVFRGLLAKPALPALACAGEIPAVYTPDPKLWRKPSPRPILTHCGETVAPVELRAVLRLVQAGSVAVAPTSWRLTDASVRLISGNLAVPDFQVEAPAEEMGSYGQPGGAIRAHGWGVAVQQCGWAKPRGGKLTLTPEGKGILARFDPEAYATGSNPCSATTSSTS